MESNSTLIEKKELEDIVSVIEMLKEEAEYAMDCVLQTEGDDSESSCNVQYAIDEADRVIDKLKSMLAARTALTQKDGEK